MRKKLIALNSFLNILLPVLTILIIDGLFYYNNLVKEAKDNATFLNRFYSQKFVDKIKETEFLLKTVASIARDKKTDKKTIEKFIKDYLEIEKSYSAVGITDKDGNIILSPIRTNQKINLSDRQYFQDAKEKLSLSTSEFLKGKITGKDIVVFAYPILDNEEKFNGVVFAGITSEKMNQIAEKIYIPENASLAVLDKNGVVLARRPDNEKWTGKNIFSKSEVVRKALSEKKAGALISEDIDQTKKVFAYQPIEYNNNNQIFIISGFPTDVIKEPLKARIFRLSVFAFIFFLVLTLTNYLLLKNFKRKGLLEN